MIEKAGFAPTLAVCKEESRQVPGSIVSQQPEQARMLQYDGDETAECRRATQGGG